MILKLTYPKPSVVQSWIRIVKKHFSASRMSNSRVKIGICQMCSTGDKLANIKQGLQLIRQCKDQGAQMAFLPEGFDSICQSKELAMEAAEFVGEGIVSEYCEAAQSQKMWLSLGGFKEKSEFSSKIYNTHLLINPEGKIVSKYRKLHLFDVDIPNKVRLCESDYTIPGKGITTPTSTPAGKVALSTCYDLRFPELSTLLRQNGAHILTYPSAFTVPTGQAHWEVLLRARAIENQCYVVAAAQTGQHNSKRSSYGHSMIIDPWGKIICEIPEEIGVAVAEVDIEKLKEIRNSIPVESHRRSEIYQLTSQSVSESINCRESLDDQDHYIFGHVKVLASAVFFKSSLSYAFVNKKPVLPGHMLISPIRHVKRFADLSPQETADLFDVVKKVGVAIQKEFQGTSQTISIQDGPEAGQTVEHVHVHVLPRRKDDFEKNDEIYEKLANHDKTEDGDPLPESSPLWRSEDDMADEAGRMRKYFFSE